MSIRPSHIGMLTVMIMVAGLLLFPLEEAQDSQNTDSDVPPALYPAFPQAPPLVIRKAPAAKEVSAGSEFHFSISIENKGSHDVSNLTVEERFNGEVVTVTEAQNNGEVDTNRITWNIPLLAPGDVWLTTYDAVISPHASPRTTETTLFVRNDTLDAATSASSRMRTSVLTVIDMPKTGVVVLKSAL